MRQSAETASEQAFDIKNIVQNILDTVEREREREIIARRFGLYAKRETLEEIGEMLGITRERVRQLEKAIMTRLRQQAEEGVLEIEKVEKHIIRHLYEMGRAARIRDLSKRIAEDTPRDHAHVALIAELTPGIAVVNETDRYYHSVAIKDHHDAPVVKKAVDEVVTLVKKHGEPLTAAELHTQSSHEHPDHVQAFASISKDLATLHDRWGLIRWPVVNPKNIRDKIYVILDHHGSPLHFSEIAKRIKDSEFKRRNVTTQAIHNELIKDARFVLIGRGIYALNSWGFKQGTVADIITDILRDEAPLHRDEIVKRVKSHRKVKETTILLNLQSKPIFKRVAKATYGLATTDTK